MIPEFELDSSSYPGKEYSWSQVWLKVLTSPSEQTFRDIVRDPKATQTRAYLWIFACTLVMYFLFVIFLALFGGSMSSYLEFGQLASDQVMVGYILIGMICGSPVFAAISVIGLVISAGFYYFVAKLLLGEATFTETVYVLAAISAPMILISSMITFIPFVNILGIFIGFYALFLQLVAIKAINGFGWGSSCITIFAIPILASTALCCLSFIAFSALGPEIGNIFSQIVTPIP